MTGAILMASGLVPTTHMTGTADTVVLLISDATASVTSDFLISPENEMALFDRSDR
jgi:hypothetical protein